MTARAGSLDTRLLNDYQRDFPLVSEPFARIADDLDAGPAQVIACLERLAAQGSVSRVGPVFRANAIGASTLAAMAVAADELAAVAAVVNTFPEVNHNYEREHRLNLWFVATAASAAARDGALARIEAATGRPVVSLPLERDYHIDLGFHMSSDACATRARHARGAGPRRAASVDGHDAALIGAIQAGLPLVARPFDAVAQRAGCTEAAVIRRIDDWLADGTIKRFGVVVRHHELGYRANAMAVWDIPDDAADGLGVRLAALPWVTLCYRRRRHPPQWPYNLYCMIHGRERAAVCGHIREMIERHALHDHAHAVLFSGRRFKQRGARYRESPTPQRRQDPHGRA